MRIPPERLEVPKGKFNLTPMIDVVFLLIIFFAVSSNLIQQDATVSVDLPSAATGFSSEKLKKKNVIVSIPSAGTFYAGSKPVSLPQLQQILHEFHRQAGSEAELRIRTDKTVPYGEIKKVLTTAAETGIVKVTFAVLDGGEEGGTK